MTALAARTGRRSAARTLKQPQLRFTGMLHSEWIKLTTLKSGIILLSATLAAMVGVGALSAWGVALMTDGISGIGDSLSPLAAIAPASGIAVAQMLIASLAALQIGSEYGTRMISTTLTASPRRASAYLAKVIVVAGTSFTVGIGGALAAYAVAQPILVPVGLDFALTANGVLGSIVGAGAYLGLIAILGLGIAALLRHSAGGIMTVLGLLLILPIVLAIISGQNDVVADLARYLPSSAGLQMVAISESEDTLTSAQANLAVAGWAGAALAGALVSIKRRDV